MESSFRLGLEVLCSDAMRCIGGESSLAQLCQNLMWTVKGESGCLSGLWSPVVYSLSTKTL